MVRSEGLRQLPNIACDHRPCAKVALVPRTAAPSRHLLAPLRCPALHALFHLHPSPPHAPVHAMPVLPSRPSAPASPYMPHARPAICTPSTFAITPALALASATYRTHPAPLRVLHPYSPPCVATLCCHHPCAVPPPTEPPTQPEHLGTVVSTLNTSPLAPRCHCTTHLSARALPLYCAVTASIPPLALHPGTIVPPHAHAPPCDLVLSPSCCAPGACVLAPSPLCSCAGTSAPSRSATTATLRGPYAALAPMVSPLCILVTPVAPRHRAAPFTRTDTHTRAAAPS
ncbi:hypothetical protein EVG20_g10134 [Dentipellis fragilis]|uniref:Uncharacterized protein n=1 Tax=Dentipellis fragilis TaxID=205917 RepID=A0A4Y9XTE6_9AGAM|nr:hypothetical protein EVG20_g10134 [Dentipellis fragilis]